jgi:hypothetical protein
MPRIRCAFPDQPINSATASRAPERGFHVPSASASGIPLIGCFLSKVTTLRNREREF